MTQDLELALSPIRCAVPEREERRSLTQQQAKRRSNLAAEARNMRKRLDAVSEDVSETAIEMANAAAREACLEALREVAWEEYGLRGKSRLCRILLPAPRLVTYQCVS